MTSIDDLKKYIKDFSHPNQFDFQLQLPTRMGLPQPPEGGKAFRMFGKAMSIPSITAENQISRIMTVLRGTALGMNYDSIIMTFYDTKTAFFHRLFNAWNLNRLGTDGSLQYYPDDYVGDIDIYLHDTNIYKLENVYPITVGDFRLDNDMTDQYGTFDVTLFVTKVVPQNLGFTNA